MGGSVCIIIIQARTRDAWLDKNNHEGPNDLPTLQHEVSIRWPRKLPKVQAILAKDYAQWDEDDLFFLMDLEKRLFLKYYGEDD